MRSGVGFSAGCERREEKEGASGTYKEREEDEGDDDGEGEDAACGRCLGDPGALLVVDERVEVEVPERVREGGHRRTRQAAASSPIRPLPGSRGGDDALVCCVHVPRVSSPVQVRLQRPTCYSQQVMWFPRGRRIETVERCAPSLSHQGTLALDHHLRRHCHGIDSAGGGIERVS